MKPNINISNEDSEISDEELNQIIFKFNKIEDDISEEEELDKENFYNVQNKNIKKEKKIQKYHQYKIL